MSKKKANSVVFQPSGIGKKVLVNGLKVGYVAQVSRSGRFQFVANDGKLGQQGSYRAVRAQLVERLS